MAHNYFSVADERSDSQNGISILKYKTKFEIPAMRCDDDMHIAHEIQTRLNKSCKMKFLPY